jgi:lysophospholipase L1-like esterase
MIARQVNQRNIIEAAIDRHPRLAARALLSHRCRSSGACTAFAKNRRLVRMLLRHLLERQEAASAGSLLCSTLYGSARRPGPVDQARLLYFTGSGEMITYDPVEERLSSTADLFPRNGCQLALFSISQENTVSFGYCTIDGSFRAVADKAGDGISMELQDGFQHLRLRERYLSAQPDGEIHANRVRPDLWERFYPLPLRHVTIHRSNLSHLATTRITAVGRGQNSIHNGADHTFIENWTVEGDFDHVRLIYMVDSSDQDLKIGAASIAAMSRLANNPADPDDRALPLIAVTFNNKGLAVDFKDQALRGDDMPAVRSLDLNGLGELGRGQLAMVPKLHLSDWMPLASLRRADGGIGRLIHIRTEIPHHAGMRGVTTSEDGRGTAADPYRLTGRSYQTCFMKGQLADASRVPELNAVPAPAQGRGLVYGLQLISRRLGATLQMVGDSIGSGYGSSTNNTGFAQLAAAAISKPSLPVHFLQSGTYAQPSSGFFAASLQDLELSDVSIAIIQTWSGNDVDPRMSGEQARQAADAAWQRALDYGRLVALRGGVPIFLSAVPQQPKCMTPEQEAARLSSAVRCRELSVLGEFTIDLNGELGDGGSPVTYAPRFLLDGLHPNQSGHEHIAALLVPMLETILQG